MILFGFFKIKKEDTTLKKQTLSAIEWPDHVETLDSVKFNEFIKKYPLSMVDFWAPWCAPCTKMAPRLRRLAKIYSGSVAFGKLNTQINHNIAKKYKISSIPHFGFFSYGKKITSITGIKTVGEIKSIIDDLLNKSN
jgi:thioredoxin 1